MSYIIAQPKDVKKPLLLKVLKTDGNKSKCVVPDASKFTTNESYLVSSRDIICTLGDEPPYGTAYGVLVEPIVGRRIVKKWGDVYTYVKHTDQLSERIDKALRITLDKLKDMNLVAWHPIKTELRNPKGKILGTYHYKPTSEDTLTLRVQEGISTRELISLIGHECGGHGVWNRQMTAEQRALWIAYYQEYSQIKSITPSDVKTMVREITKLQSIRDYQKECEPEELASLHIYTGWLQSVHNFSKRDFQDLVSSGSKPPIPDTHLHKGDIQTPLTLYSKTNPEELFAEAMGLFLIDGLTSKRLRKMIKML